MVLEPAGAGQIGSQPGSPLPGLELTGKVEAASTSLNPAETIWSKAASCSTVAAHGAIF